MKTADAYDWRAEAAEIWKILKETDKYLKEGAQERQKFKEGMKELRLSQQEAAQERKEFRKEFKEGMKELRLSQQEAAQERQKFKEGMKELRLSQQETDKQLKETAKQLKKSDARFNTQWGKLVEALFSGGAAKALQKYNIKVTGVIERRTAFRTDEKGETHKREFDLIVVNGHEAVVIEVKTTLTPDDVKYFSETMKDFKQYCPRYRNDTVYGGMAFLKSDAQAALYAERQGLFALRAEGQAQIVNQKNFEPKIF